MIDLKQMSGIMNTDDNNDTFPPFHHKYLMNGRFRGNGSNMRLENISGNVLIPNYLLPTGTNQQNGGLYDSVKRRIIWWNYNSNGRHGIYIYDIGTKVLSKVFLCFTDSTTDILNLSLDYPVHSASIVYRTDGDGDLLFWVQDNDRPKFINLDTVDAMQPFTSDMIYVAKNVPLTPLVCSYQNDSAVNSNNLRKKIFRFAQRWVYKNLEKSTISTISKPPLPVNGYDPDTNNDSTLNNNILIPIYGGGDDYQSIELLMQYNDSGNTWTDFFSVATFDRDDYNIPPGGIYNFHFFNDSDYIPIDPADTTLYYDRIPDIARAMEVLNGNHILYANTTDGYNGLTRAEIDVTLSSGVSAPNIPSISYNYTGGNFIIVTIGPVIITGSTYHVHFDYVSGGVPGSVNFDYVTPPSATLFSITLAMAIGITGGIITGTYSSSGIFQVGVDGIGVIILNVIVSTTVSGAENASPSFKWTCAQRFGLQYLDQWDKPVGGVYSFVSDNALDTTDFSVTTPDFIVSTNVLIPFIAATINHVPPEGAVAYHWVRSELTPKFIYWITNDYQYSALDPDFIYVCIQNLYYQSTQSTGFVPTYDFAKGDRVRVIAQFDNISQSYTPYSIQLDFEILGTVQKTMTSPTSSGTFLKITKPTIFPSVPYQAQMLIEIYTPRASTPSDLLVFKEWGEKYDIYSEVAQILTYTLAFGTFQVGETIIEAVTNITSTITSVSSTQLTVINATGTYLSGLTFTGMTSGAAGTITNVQTGASVKYHQGQINNQTATQPATFQWFDGDVYFKNRTFYLNVGSTTQGDAFMMDANYNDYFPSAVNANGRGWIIQPDAKIITNGVEIRWGGGYLQDTNINELNRFRPENIDVLDLSKGNVLRLLSEERRVYIYHQRSVGSVGVYSRYIKNNQGEQELISTDELITKNNIYYLKGNYGLQNQPCAVFRADNGNHYFIDDNNGDQLRRAGDGIDNIGSLYWGKYFFSDIITPYNSTYLRTDGSKAKIMGFFDFFEGQAHFILQGGVYQGHSLPSYNFSFNPDRKGYNGFYDYANIDWALQAASITYSWKNGQFYIHNDEVKRCNFYGVQYYTSITLVFNTKDAIIKTFESLGYQSQSKKWVCSKLNAFAKGENIDAIITSTVNEQTGFRQSSRLKYFDFSIENTKTTAALLKDINSGQNGLAALYEGDYLTGSWVECTFTYKGSDYVFLYAPYMNFAESNRNF